MRTNKAKCLAVENSGFLPRCQDGFLRKRSGENSISQARVSAYTLITGNQLLNKQPPSGARTYDQLRGIFVKISEELLPAWKIIASPDSVEEEWLEAYDRVGDKAPPPAVLESGYYYTADHKAKETLRDCLLTAVLAGRTGAFVLDTAFMCGIFTLYQILVSPFDLSAIVLAGEAGVLEQLSLLFTFSWAPFFGMFMPDHAVLALLSWVYHAVFQASPLMATPGEWAFGLRVTDKNGQRLSLAHATTRHIARIFVPLSLGLAYLLPVVNRQHRSIEDLATGTQVIHTDHQKIAENFETLPLVTKQKLYPYV